MLLLLLLLLLLVVVVVLVLSECLMVLKVLEMLLGLIEGGRCRAICC